MVKLADLEPRQAGQLQVRGGVGGISFQLQELLNGAQRLEVLTAELRDVEARLQGIQGTLFSYQLDTPATGAEAVVAVRRSLSHLSAVRTALESLSGSVRAAHRDYEYNEVLVASSRLLGPFRPSPSGSEAGLMALWPPGRQATESLVGSSPVALGLLLLGLPGGKAVTILAAHVAAGRSPSDIRSVVRLVAESSAGRLEPRRSSPARNPASGLGLTLHRPACWSAPGSCRGSRFQRWR